MRNSAHRLNVEILQKLKAVFTNEQRERLERSSPLYNLEKLEVFPAIIHYKVSREALKDVGTMFVAIQSSIIESLSLRGVENEEFKDEDNELPNLDPTRLQQFHVPRTAKPPRSLVNALNPKAEPVPFALPMRTNDFRESVVRACLSESVNKNKPASRDFFRFLSMFGGESPGMDKTKITRKPSKMGKHGYENGRVCKSRKPNKEATVANEKAQGMGNLALKSLREQAQMSHQWIASLAIRVSIHMIQGLLFILQ
ncbi:hypothetical protein Tco_0603332 [Tanacetum coccineum]